MRTCPFCAEEIKVEAIKCKHCGSEMPEVQQKIIIEQAKQIAEEQKAVAVMDANWAKGKLNGSYFFTIVGIFLSYALMNYAGMNIKTNLPVFSVMSIVFMYCCWSIYWGMQIVHDPIKNWYSGLFVMGTGVTDLFLKQLGMFLAMYLIVIPLFGLIVGALGGGIVRSLKCVAIANNKLVANDVVATKIEERQIKPIESPQMIKREIKNEIKSNETVNAIKPIVAWSILGGILVLIAVCYFVIMRK